MIKDTIEIQIRTPPWIGDCWSSRNIEAVGLATRNALLYPNGVVPGRRSGTYPAEVTVLDTLENSGLLSESATRLESMNAPVS